MKPKRITAFLLSVAMILSLVPTFSLTAFADETQTPTTTTEKNITLGTSAIKGGQASNVWFGNYQQSYYTPTTAPVSPANNTVYTDDDGTKFVYLSKMQRYYKIEPIKWRVLSNADEKVFLLSDQNLDVFQYHTDCEDVTWEKSTMRSWLNGYEAKENNGGDSGIDYSTDNFIGNAFSGAEQKRIVKTSIVNDKNPTYNTNGGNDTKDPIFLLSIAEVQNTAYGFTDNTSNTDTRKSTNNNYVAGGGKLGSDEIWGTGQNQAWWLRSPGDRTTFAAYVTSPGLVSDNGDKVDGSYLAVRPALNIGEDSVLFTASAENGKSVTAGLQKTTVYSGTDYKLTLLDGDRDFNIDKSDRKKKTFNKEITVGYSGATTGDNEYISAIITADNSNDVLYYGQVAEVSAESGTITITLPSDIADGKYTLKLFNEQINGDYKTDFSSAFSDVALTIGLEGNGTASDPYLIYTLSDLEYFRDKVNNEKSYEGEYVKLMDNIVMSEKYNATTGESWTPIGIKENNETKYFKGTFDGNGKKINGLYITGNNSRRGLFGNILNATIKNLAVTGEISGRMYIGGIVAVASDCDIENCESAVIISGTDVCIGGIVGWAFRCNIRHCRNVGNITVNSNEVESVGGIVGQYECFNAGSKSYVIEDCYNTGNIIVKNAKKVVGGIAGIAQKVDIKNCYSVGMITAPSTVTDVGPAIGKKYESEVGITNVFYLNECAGTDTKFANNYGTAKTDTEFASGEVTYALQGNRDTIVWGQNIGEDKIPILTSSDDKKVYKITFLTGEKNTESDPYAVRYANKNFNEANFPQNPDDECEYWWSLTNDVNGTKFDKNTEITKDMTVYGVKKEITVASDESDTITLNKNTEITTPINLNDYVKNKSGNEKNFAFELVEGQTLPDGLQFDDNTGKITGKPTKVGTYTVKFQVANNGISLMSLETVNDVDILTLTIDVDLEGEGTVGSPYLINDLGELEYFRDKVNGGKNYSGEYVKLMNNIDMADKYSATTKESWTRIGTGSKMFNGTFDGNGKEIQNLYINDENTTIGLFGNTATNSLIKNLGVTGNVTGNDYVGGIVGVNNGTIEHCYYKGTVKGNKKIGGIVGEQSNGEIVNCYCTGEISGEEDIGGITGYFESAVKNCYSLAEVSGQTNVGGIAGSKGSTYGNIDNCYYLDTCVTNGNDYGTAKTEAEFNSGYVAFGLQVAQTERNSENKVIQVWGQKLTNTAGDGETANNDKYPVLTSEENKTVYRILFVVNDNRNSTYSTYEKKYGNDGDKVTLPEYDGTNKEMFRGWSTEQNKAENIVTDYTVDKSKASSAIDKIEVYSIWNTITFEPTNTQQTYQTGTARTITINPKLNDESSNKLKTEDFDVEYYLVNENKNELYSTTPEDKAISAGKYLYVITLKNGTDSEDYGYIKREYNVADTTLPDITNYDNVGYMLITSGAETAQKPIYFKEGTINLKVGGTFENELTNENGTTPEIKTSNESVASAELVDGKVKVTAIGKGTATITATSTKDNTTPVYASFTVNVGLATKTLTAENFNIVATSKTYDETDSVTLTATLKDGVAYEGDNLKFDITGNFENANAGNDKKVSYEITGITGTGAENYVLENDKISISAEDSTVKANIEKAQVTIICSETTTRTFDGNAQTVDVSAMANGKVFDKSNYTILYNDKAAVNTENEKYPSAANSYKVTIKLNDNVKQNYEVTQPTATLVIKSATQDVFSIEGVPEVVYYGDTFELSNSGATGDVTYTSSDSDILAITGSNAVAKSTGKVTITATSTKDGYNNRVATKTIEVKKRILTPTATADYTNSERTYDGTSNVKVKIALDNVLEGDAEKVAASATGTMVNADAGTGKIVYVNGITLSGEKRNLYTLSSTSIQTTVDITPIEITGFTISADKKKYDGTTTATASVEGISGVLSDDEGKVEIAGKAVFDTKDSGNDKTVTFTAAGLSGAKAQNYVLGESAKTATAKAKIEPLKVDFIIGQTTFVYDENETRSISVSASDENGKIFKDYSVEYKKDGNSVTPNEVGTYTATITLKDTTNYYTEQGDIELTISEATQDSLVIVGLPGTIQYGDEFELEAVGGENGDDATYLWECENKNIAFSNTEVANPTVTINGAVGDTVEITVTKSNVANYDDITARVVFVPTAKTVVFKLSKLTQGYSGDEINAKIEPMDSKGTALSLEEGTDYTVTYDGKADAPTDAGTYAVSVTAKGNYTGVQTATLNIKKATATGTITGVSASYTYGTTVDKDQITATSTMGSVGPTITFAGTGIYVPQEDAPTKVGNYTVIAEFTDSNYETLTVTKSFEITKRELKVSVMPDIEGTNTVERPYGEANPIFKLEYDGFVGDENKDVLLSEPIATVNANASSKVGTYPIKISGGSAENYYFTYDDSVKLKINGASGSSLIITGATNTVHVGDTFTLLAYYGNSKVKVAWTSSDGSVVDINETTGEARALKASKAGEPITITATAGENYGNATATFMLTVKKTEISLYPTGLVKTYTGERQDISFADNADFTPVIGENVTVEYTLISDPTVKAPIQAGTYSVVYTINDGSYTGGGNTTMYITKATVAAKVNDVTKVYGDEYDESEGYGITITNNGGVTNAEALEDIIKDIKALATITSDGAAKTAVVKDGGYEITPTLSSTETDNVKFTVEKGTLTVTKAPLTIKAKDVSREYGAENPALEVEYTGFKNDETKDVLGGELVLSYDESINAETAVGKYEDKTTASGLISDNYEITFDPGDVEITKIAVNASAGTSRASYLTVKFDKAVEGVTFKVTDTNGDVEITSVTASSDNKTYTLNGTFTVGTEYTVEITYDNATQDISNKTLKITPTKSSSGGGGGGGSSAPATYTVTFETNGGSKIDSVKVEKNKTVAKPTEPTKDGFEFDGWYSDKKLTTAYDFDTKVTKAITLYAKWTEKKVDDNKDDNNKPTPSEWKNPFTDVTNADWFFDNVKYANQNGLMSGTTATTFAPNDNLTRGMLVTVLYRAEGEPAAGKSIPFADVKADMYYANAVIWAEQNGIVKGVSETEYAPDENITREQIAAILYRYASYKGYDVTQGGMQIREFEDYESISDYAMSAITWAVNTGLMKGKTQAALNPKDNATRAELAAILQRFIEGNK